jgi:hypothetical protein
MPLYQTRARLEPTLNPICIGPDTLGLFTSDPLDVIVGVDGCGGAGSGSGLCRFVLGGKGGRGRGRRGLGRAPGGMRVVREVATMTGSSGKRLRGRGARWVEGCGPTPGLLVVGGVGAGSDSSIERWGAVS